MGWGLMSEVNNNGGTPGQGGSGVPDPEGKPAVGWGGQFHRFFIIPAVVVLLVFLIGYVFSAGSEPWTVDRYLDTISERAGTARWQAAMDLSRVLSDPANVPNSEAFTRKLQALFADPELHRQDARVRLFLGLAMARTGNPVFFDDLKGALAATSAVEEQAVYIRALGLLHDERARATLQTFEAHPDPVLRHEVAQALGYLGGAESRDPLLRLLADTEPNVRWDAAVSLAKLGDASGKAVLAQLMDRAYYDTVPDVRPEGRAWAMEVALRAAGPLNDPDLNAKIRELAASDPNVTVRAAALEVVKALEEERKP